METCREKKLHWTEVDYRPITHKVVIDGLRVGIKSLMATVRGPGLKDRGAGSQQGLGSTGGQDWGRLYSSVWLFLSSRGERFDKSRVPY